MLHPLHLVFAVFVFWWLFLGQSDPVNYTSVITHIQLSPNPVGKFVDKDLSLGGVKQVLEFRTNSSETDLAILDVSNVPVNGFAKVFDGVYARYGPSTHAMAVTDITILFGEDVVDPRPNWELKLWQIAGFDTFPRLSLRRGPEVDFSDQVTFPSGLKLRDGKFKILQAADLHFSTGVGECLDPVPAASARGCKADLRSLKFLNKSLALEEPDLVVLTGDQIFGPTAPDSETAIFKVVSVFVERKTPFAVVLGNHDDEGSLSKAQLMTLIASLPYSKTQLGPESIPGFGNYVLDVGHHIALYFLDSHSYSLDARYPGYDWIKMGQLRWLELQKKNALLSMAFFHIPLPQYGKSTMPGKGQRNEIVSSGKLDEGARAALGRVGVDAISVGHDHLNEFCQLDTTVWLCYGGGAGEGGYGGLNMVRRVRVFEFDVNKKSLKTWKLPELDPERRFDVQVLRE